MLRTHNFRPSNVQIDVQLYARSAAVTRLEARQGPERQPPPTPNFEDRPALGIVAATITTGALCAIGII